jgi:hypothetical protein
LTPSAYFYRARYYRIATPIQALVVRAPPHIGVKKPPIVGMSPLLRAYTFAFATEGVVHAQSVYRKFAAYRLTPACDARQLD